VTSLAVNGSENLTGEASDPIDRPDVNVDASFGFDMECFFLRSDASKFDLHDLVIGTWPLNFLYDLL